MTKSSKKAQVRHAAPKVARLKARVDAAAKIAHEAASAAYIATYRRVLAAAMSSDSARRAA